MFTTPTGGPLNPRTDYTEWKRLLERAGVPERRLHDTRHTAATVLLRALKTSAVSSYGCTLDMKNLS